MANALLFWSSSTTTTVVRAWTLGRQQGQQQRHRSVYVVATLRQQSMTTRSIRTTLLLANAVKPSLGSSTSSFRSRRPTSYKRKSSSSSSSPFSLNAPDKSDEMMATASEYYARPVVQWYPGHIAKAERVLAETIKAVDVVIEVRDARLPLATSHPLVASWCAQTPRIVVLTRADAIPTVAQQAWRQALERTVISSSSSSNSDIVSVRFWDASTGAGLHSLIRAITDAGQPVHARREARGLLGRPLRVGILGYPNVGKSTLINRIIGGKKRCKTANIPGVTRALQWIRVRSDSVSSTKRGREFEVLDSPGVIPATLTNQSDAMLVAACHCIGERAYDNLAVAIHLNEYLLRLHRHGNSHAIAMVAPQWRQKCIDRYHFDPLVARAPSERHETFESERAQPAITKSRAATSATTRLSTKFAPEDSFTGEDMLFAVADATCQGNPEDAARKILQDFRTGRLGPMCLQIAPSLDATATATTEPAATTTREAKVVSSAQQQIRNVLQQEQQERSVRALETVKARGLVLPGTEGEASTERDNSSVKDKSTIGKGLFDGW
jgi:ribosome biogenesis GTPase A